MPKRIISTTCKTGFYFECPVEWNKLDSIDDSVDRWCKTCKRQVHRTNDPKKVRELAKAGECVAILYRKQYAIGVYTKPAPSSMDEWLVDSKEGLDEG